MTAADSLFPLFAVSIARFVVGGIFIWSGGVKLHDLEGFALIATSYSIIPHQLTTPARATAYLVPFLELFSGALIVIWEAPVYALAAIMASLLGYTAIEIYELVFGAGSKDNCGCYGTAITVPLSWWQVGKNVILFTLAAYLLGSIVM